MPRRIIEDPKIRAGKPVFEGTRIPIQVVLRKLAAGEDPTELLQGYPDLTLEDLRAAIGFASDQLDNSRVIALEGAR